MEFSDQLHDPAALPPGKEFLVRNIQKAGWAPGPVCTRRRRNESIACTGNRNPANSHEHITAYFVKCAIDGVSARNSQ